MSRAVTIRQSSNLTQSPQEINEVFLLLIGEFHVEPAIVEIDHFAQGFRRPFAK